MSFIDSFSFINEYKGLFIKGLIVTLELSVISIVAGSIFGFVLTIMNKSKIKLIHLIAKGYIGLIRDTPLLIQIYLVYIGLPLVIGVSIPDFLTGAIALSLSASAYISENIRSGIDSIPTGQAKAARSLGMSKFQAMRDIIIPQVLKDILPALLNQFIGAVKGSSLVSVIGLGDLMYEAQVVRGSTALGIQPIIVASLIYLVVNMLMNICLSGLRKRMA